MNLSFKILEIQGALFLSDFSLADKLSFSQELLDKTNGTFDADPLILPSLKNAPHNLPKIILKNKENSYFANISLEKLDFFFKTPEGEEKTDIVETTEDFLKKFNKIYTFLLTYKHTRISRVGFIMKFFIELATDTSTFLKKKFIKADVFPKAHSLDIVELEKISLDEFNLNKIIKIQSFIKKSEKNPTGLLLHVDINTIK